MNQLKATLTAVRSSGLLTHIETQCLGHHLDLLLAESSHMDDIQEKEVTLVFKETEVILLKSVSDTTANQFHGIIMDIEQGEILTQVEIDINGALIRSLVPTSMFLRINAVPGEPIVCMINPTEISLLRSVHGN